MSGRSSEISGDLFDAAHQDWRKPRALLDLTDQGLGQLLPQALGAVIPAGPDLRAHGEAKPCPRALPQCGYDQLRETENGRRLIRSYGLRAKRADQILVFHLARRHDHRGSHRHGQIALAYRARPPGGAPELAPGRRAGAPELAPERRAGAPELAPERRAGARMLAPERRVGARELAPERRAGARMLAPVRRAGARMLAPVRRAEYSSDCWSTRRTPRGRSGRPRRVTPIASAS